MRYCRKWTSWKNKLSLPDVPNLCQGVRGLGQGPRVPESLQPPSRCLARAQPWASSPSSSNLDAPVMQMFIPASAHHPLLPPPASRTSQRSALLLSGELLPSVCCYMPGGLSLPHSLENLGCPPESSRRYQDWALTRAVLWGAGESGAGRAVRLVNCPKKGRDLCRWEADGPLGIQGLGR